MSLVKQRIIERQSKRRSVTYPEEAQTKNSIFKAFTFQGGTRTPADRATLICVCKAAFTKTERESNMCHKTKKTHSNTSSLNHTRLQRSTIKNAVKGGKEINLSGNTQSSKSHDPYTTKQEKGTTANSRAQPCRENQFTIRTRANRKA